MSFIRELRFGIRRKHLHVFASMSDSQMTT